MIFRDIFISIYPQLLHGPEDCTRENIFENGFT